MVGYVACDGDVGPVGGEGDFGSFRVNHEVDVGLEVGEENAARCHQQVGVEVAAHDDELARIRGEVGIKADRERDVGQGSGGVNADFARVFAHTLDHEFGGTDVGERVVREAGGESGLDEASGIAAGRVCVFGGGVLRCKGAFPWEFAVDIFPGLEELGSVEEGIIGTLVNWNTAQIASLKRGEGMVCSLARP